MPPYIQNLAALVFGTFVGSLAALALAAQPFNVLTFDWGVAMTVSGSAAVLALLKGLAARFVGDPGTTSLRR